MRQLLIVGLVCALAGFAGGWWLGRGQPTMIEGDPQRQGSAPGPELTGRGDRAANEARSGRATVQPAAVLPDVVASGPAAAALDRGAQCVDALARSKAEADGLRADLAASRAKISKLLAKEAAGKVYGLEPEELRALAESCTLRWDTLDLDSPQPQTLGGSDQKALAFSEADKAAADAVFASFRQESVTKIRGFYQAVTGDPNPGSLTEQAMLAEVMQQAGKLQIQQIFQRLAAERAGLLSPPGDPSTASPAEQLFRWLTGSGDLLEQELARRLGPEKAHALRALHDGFGSKNSSSHGCPPAPPSE